jgi:hypothetical protein
MVDSPNAIPVSKFCGIKIAGLLFGLGASAGTHMI